MNERARTGANSHTQASNKEARSSCVNNYYTCLIGHVSLLVTSVLEQRLQLVVLNIDSHGCKTSKQHLISVGMHPQHMPCVHEQVRGHNHTIAILVLQQANASDGLARLAGHCQTVNLKLVRSGNTKEGGDSTEHDAVGVLK